MPDPLEAMLVTKLFVPLPPRLAVPRPRLRLERALKHPLTLITAPAGYGKTSLVTTWLQEVTQPSAWLSLDNRDNDEVRFWRYVVAALSRIHPSLEQHLSAYLASPRFAYEPFLTALINHLSEVDVLILVLDDYHLIENESIHAGVAFWLEHLPPPLHLVIASRSEPPLPLAKMRVKQRLLEVTVDDLRFSKEEVEGFLSEVMDLDLSQEEITVLERYTEGWAASLHLAALSLQSVEGTRSIDALMRTNRFVFDYFADEVFSRQPSDIQAFLLHTSLLERFSAELCAFLMESTPEEARARIAQLEAANLFIIPLDAEKRWFRFHPLFAEFLQRRLQETTPERVPELYIRAAEWCEAHGLTDEAIRYVLAGGDIEGAVALVERHDRALLWQPHGRAALRPWLDALPEDVIRARARLCLDHAWLLTGTADTALLDHRLSDLTRLLGEEVESSAEANLRGELAVIQAERVTEQGDYTQALTLLNNALGLLTDPLLRGVALQSKGYLLRTKGQLLGAEEVLQEAAKLCAETDNFTLYTFALSDLGEVYKMRGRLHNAVRTFQKALTSDSQRFPAESGALIGLADVLREKNQLDEAEVRVRVGLELAAQAQFGNVQAYGEVMLARILSAKGALDEGIALLRQASEREVRRGNERRAATFNLHRAALSLRHSDTAAARSLLARSVRPQVGLRGLTYARLLFAEGQFDAAQPLLTELIHKADASGRVGRLIAALVLQARVLESDHKTNAAVDALTRALELAQPEGFVRVFLDEGEPLRTLLQRVVLAGGSAYATTLLATFPSNENTTNEVDASLHLLTKREQQVLALIAEGLSNEAIAETLIRSTGTIKSHTSSIYSKLGVRGRTEAVARARGLGLLE